MRNVAVSVVLAVMWGTFASVLLGGQQGRCQPLDGATAATLRGGYCHNCTSCGYDAPTYCKSCDSSNCAKTGDHCKYITCPGDNGKYLDLCGSGGSLNNPCEAAHNQTCGTNVVPCACQSNGQGGFVCGDSGNPGSYNVNYSHLPCPN